MELKFRTLKAEEIDCRVAIVKENGCSLLLYKDARVDQNLLDATVGALGWQRDHQIIGNNLYCTVSVYDNEREIWIRKQDVGTESFTEKEKGQASDSFKRACFNFGIGRELYTAPFIWIPSDKCTITKREDKKFVTYDTFYVSQIFYDDDKNITKLAINNCKTKRNVFAWSNEQCTQ